MERRLLVVQPDHLRLGRDEARARSRSRARRHAPTPAAKERTIDVTPPLAAVYESRPAQPTRASTVLETMIEPERWRDHLPPHVLEDEKRAGQVDVDDAPPDVVLELGETLVLRVDEVDVRGAVVEDVDPAEAGDRVGDELLHELGRRDVDCIATAVPPLSVIDEATASARSSAMSETTTDAPSAAIAAAPARPMPDPPPTTSATFPSSRAVTAPPSRAGGPATGGTGPRPGSVPPPQRLPPRRRRRRGPAPSIAPQRGPLAIGIGSVRMSCSIRYAVC